ncbi:NUDIX domain-containing protein [Protofrankia symbiont of Coriaria ruscifolia]|uniref:NUDIX domain-containing protein n=1 Tax=Protofrankia symbiont of Coriaria ruscifolia TaxID=1306542 RepID=UPI0010417766|nr:NUDIX hydrolase [Protofrankia symbiont of Coriaria ruscifolia]
MTTTTHETARLTADVVALSERAGTLHVLVIRRGWAPYEGLWALPGGHVDPGEDVETAARRELLEETGIVADHLDPVAVYSAPGRDPRGRYVTFAFAARLAAMPTPTAGDDATAARWVPVDDVLADGLAFDHAQILTDALAVVSVDA